jgi:DNA-binding GntR family transcriptional regulator
MPARRRGRIDNSATFDSLDPIDRQTTPGMIAARIRRAIIDGSFPPGMQLTESQLAERLAVSRGPVREAMQRLIQEGLLRNERHRGVFVVLLDAEDVTDVYLARAAVERTAARLLAERAQPEVLATLEAAVDELEHAAETADWSSVADLDLRFHELLVGATGSKRLSRMFRTLLAETRICLRDLEAGYPVRSDLVAEHRAILDALREGDEALVLEVMDSHFETALADLREGREPTGEHAIPAPS